MSANQTARRRFDASRRLAVCRLWLVLEGEVRGQLHRSRSATAQKRVARAHVRCRCGLFTLRAGPRQQLVARGNWIGECIDAKTRQQRVRQVRVVEEVEKVSAQRKRNRTGQPCRLGQRDVEVGVAGRVECAAPFAAGMFGAARTGPACAVPRAGRGKGGAISKAAHLLVIS